MLENISYLGNSSWCFIRLITIVMGQACVHDEASVTRLVVSNTVKVFLIYLSSVNKYLLIFDDFLFFLFLHLFRVAG